MQTSAGPVYGASISVSSYELCLCWFRRPCFLGVIYPFWLLPSSVGFPEPCGEGLDGDIPFRAEWPKVFDSLHNVWLWVSVFVPICCWRELFWWWLTKYWSMNTAVHCVWVLPLLCTVTIHLCDIKHSSRSVVWLQPPFITSFMVTDDVGQLFMCLFVISSYSWIKYLFRPFA